MRPWFTGTLDSYGGATVAAARQMGKVHAAHVLAGRAGAVPVALAGLRISQRVMRLALQAPLSYRRFKAEGFGDYTKTLGEPVVRAAWQEARRKRSVPFATQVLSFNPEHHLVFWSGEVCAEVGIGLKDLCPGQIVTPHGYANGCVGYIPAEHMFMLKGYEVDRSCCIYKLPAPFRPDLERRILRTALALIGAPAANRG